MASGRYYREVFVSAQAGGQLLEGFIDLLYDDDGGLVVVDYKTDVVDDDKVLTEARQRYGFQVGAYALAVQRATGKPVKELCLIFLREGQTERFTDIAERVAAAEAKIPTLA
ncbi:MAG: PD-(D/E)XK nuclease family protein [Chloroflexi bacterium]|nr:PD-(D/E)XK nuclease family protein [Chloroflexota bacterium]